MIEQLRNLMDQSSEDRVNIKSLTQKISVLEQELEAELARRRAKLRFGIERGKVIFEEEVLRRHRELRVSLLSYISKAKWRVALTAFVIYPLIIPLVFLDICISIYQALCFPVYGIAKVKRSDHFVFDRAHLAYLNILQKLNCAYCSYANGLFSYACEIGGRTEAYWCPIKHARRMAGTHKYYLEFADYGDADAFQKTVVDLSRVDERAP